MTDIFNDSSQVFPGLTWENFQWTCSMTLSAWQGFQERQGAYSSVSSDAASDGRTELNIEPAQEKYPPSLEQATAFRF